MDGIVPKSASTLEKLCYGRTVLIPIINLRRIALSETQRKCGQAMCLLLIINRFFFIVWVSSFNPLLGRTRSRGRCRAAIRLSHRPEPSGRAIHGQVDGLDSEGQYGQPVYSSATHSQAAEEAITHLYKQERKRPALVRRRLSRTQAVLGRVIPGNGYRSRGWKCCPLRIPLVIRPLRQPYEMLCGGYKWVSRFQAPCICTRWTSERWVEQVSRLHGTAC